MPPWLPLTIIIIGVLGFLASLGVSASAISSSDNYNNIKTSLTISSIINIVATIAFMLGIGMHISGDPAAAYRIILMLVGVSLLVSLSSLTVSLLEKTN